MKPADLAVAIDWAASEGWNPGLDDAAAFYAAAPGGFLMGFLDGVPVAAVSVVAYGADFGFLGLYICAAPYRGKGYGMQVWQAGMARLGERTVGLDGVVAQQANYARSGFVLTHRNIRYGGHPAGGAPRDPHVVAMSPALIDRALAYDRGIFPGPRSAFLRAWLSSPSRRGLAYIADNKVRGYGVIRPCREGFKIGPLFADGEAIATALFEALAAEAEGGTVYLDAPEPNAAARALAARYRLSPVFETARMYKGKPPDEPLSRIFGVTTFELG